MNHMHCMVIHIGRLKSFYLLALLLTVVPGSVNSVLAEQPPAAVAKVNGTILTESNLQRALNEIMPAGAFHGGFSSEKRETYRPQAIERMIEKELFYQHAVRLKMTVDKAVVENARNRVIQRVGGRDKYQIALKRAGITKDKHTQELEKKLLTKAFIQREIALKATTSEQDAKRYYKNNFKKFRRPEARRIRHILIAVKPSADGAERQSKEALAHQILKRIKDGEDMAVLAGKYSNDKYRIKGGDYGLVHVGRLNPELEKEVFKLKLNEISTVIKTIYGFHIARVEGIKSPEQVPFEEVSEKIRKMMTNEKAKQIRSSLLDRLRDTATITVY